MQLFSGHMQEPGKIAVSDADVRERIAFLGLTPEDLGEIARWKSALEAHLNRLVDAFYTTIEHNPKVWATLTKHSTVERQRPMLSRYITTMFSGVIDDQYVAYRERVGRVHEEIDLDTAYYLAMYEVIYRESVVAVRKAGARGGAVARFEGALRRLLQVDQALCLGTFTESRRQRAVGAIDRMVSGLAEGSSEQAATLQEISATLLDIGNAVEQAAANAAEAQRLAARNEELTNDGRDRMNDLSAAMDRINAASEATAKIVRSIDGIAAQTNLLSLNAAVEAARAGEAGRGFMVVANEVRNLAQQSAEAARTTTDLIQGSVQSVRDGVAMNQQVAHYLETIASEVGQLVARIRDIATAAEQQNESLGQINVALDQLNQATQHNAASAQEAAAAAAELSGEGGRRGANVGTPDFGARDARRRATSRAA